MGDVAKVASIAVIFGLLLVPPANADATWVTPGWAGYVVRAAGGSFAQASGSWSQPRVVCNRPGSSVAIWLGLGGAGLLSRTLEQVGTSADCSDRGQPSYTAWYELFPAAPVELPFAVSPGDKLHASVTVTGWLVSVTLTDASTGNAFSEEIWMRAPEVDSAEWIVEAPSACLRTCAPLPLADFDRVTFAEASTTVATHTGTITDAGWARLRLQMAPRPRRTVATTTALSGGGSSFSVVRRRSLRSR